LLGSKGIIIATRRRPDHLPGNSLAGLSYSYAGILVIRDFPALVVLGQVGGGKSAYLTILPRTLTNLPLMKNHAVFDKAPASLDKSSYVPVSPQERRKTNL